MLDRAVWWLITLDEKALVEKLAEQAHKAWAGWAKWMLAHWDKKHASGVPFVERWEQLAATAYADLSEADKESDRAEARGYLLMLQHSAALYYSDCHILQLLAVQGVSLREALVRYGRHLDGRNGTVVCSAGIGAYWLHGRYHPGPAPCDCGLDGQLGGIALENAQAVNLLNEYAHHRKECAAWQGQPCSCGLDALRERMRETGLLPLRGWAKPGEASHG